MMGDDGGEVERHSSPIRSYPFTHDLAFPEENTEVLQEVYDYESTYPDKKVLMIDAEDVEQSCLLAGILPVLL